MGNFLLLATEAHAVEHGGFGLNFDILEANLINLVILIGILIYFGRSFLGNVLGERQSRIETAIQEAEQRRKQAASALSEAQQKLTQAQAEAQQIRKAAEENAKKAREVILAKAAQDVERLQETAAQDLNTETERAIAELRQRVATMTMQRVESQLKAQLDDSAQGRLIDSSIALLGGK